MPNITFNNIASDVSSNANFVAASVSTNFNNVTAAVNNFNLDSVNYGLSTAGDAFLSNHFSAKAIVSQHISAGAVVSQKLSNNAVVSRHISANAVVSEKLSNSSVVASHAINYSNDSGVRAVQAGPNLPAGGVALARYEQSVGVSLAADPYTATMAISYSDAVDGDPGFTDTPVFLGEPIVTNINIVNGQKLAFITANNSLSCAIFISYQPAIQTVTLTYHIQVIGGI